MGQEKPKVYTAEFKGSAVKLANESSQPIAQTARDIGVNENTLHTWSSKYSRAVDNTKATRTDDHSYEALKRLKKEVALLTEERNLLLRALGVKKAAAYLCPVGALPRNTSRLQGCRR
jgi:transposase